jgi:hypothetical protein
VQGRSKEKRYAFDVAQGTQASSKDVYDSTIADLVSGVMRGLNGTVFAYGATGSGKTHTMVGGWQLAGRPWAPAAPGAPAPAPGCGGGRGHCSQAGKPGAWHLPAVAAAGPEAASASASAAPAAQAQVQAHTLMPAAAPPPQATTQTRG